MATQPEGVAYTVNDHHNEQHIPNRPQTSQRKSSFSEALTKITSNTFNRRRTNTGIPSSTSSIAINHHSRIPTPAGIDRSTSFFSTLNTFASKSTTSTSEESPQPPLTRRSRKISERLAQTPFFSHQHQQQCALTPRNNRESSVKIEQRGLMQPVHPPLPRSNTIGNLGQSQQSSPHTPGFMRPTTSSARRSSTMGRSNTAAPSSMAGGSNIAVQCQRNSSLRTITGSSTPSKTPTQARQVPADAFPARNDSLVSAPSMTDGPGPAFESETNSTDYSDGANFQVTNQHAHEIVMTKESDNGKPKASADHMYQIRRGPQAKDAKRGILKSNNKNHNLSEDLSNLYVDGEVDSSKGERDIDEMKARSDQGTLEYSERTGSPESSNPRLIHEAQAPMWWLGRYTALSDRFRTSALPSPPSSPSRPQSSKTEFSSMNEPSQTGLTSASSSNANHPMHDTDRRNRRVYIHLRSLCTTEEARASLDEFKGIMEAREKKIAAGSQGKTVKEKQGWLEGLMGKKKKGEK
ncbi:hypothetical protein HO173_008037 [Letharia columbiana]|uniref:Uncharacterized protein n=1 Tax=Letharia columbiana TaxID=112416 RepID=A0A8H6FSE9_9LECA|nr:uncharacterized protein HO173_008037 [Letharia columbiana]KAF6233825.1 hypothetical protein HO173_008037 [Letharia columbiana]